MIGYIFLYFILSMIASLICTHHICEVKYHYVVWDQKIIRPLILVAFFIFWPLLLLGHYLQFLYWILKE
jgi:hypothetical protein